MFSNRLMTLATLMIATGICAIASPSLAKSKTATTTTLAVTVGGHAVTSVASGTVVALTAQVTAGGNGVTPGNVNFCDAVAKYCTDVHLLGTAQLTSTGTATLRFRPGIGSHSYKAEFVGTSRYSESATGASVLTATGTIPQLSTRTMINQSGRWGAYALSATVTEAGNPAMPTGPISFMDTNHGNASLGTAMLQAGTHGVAWTNVNTSAPNLAGVSYIPADLNNDGILDLFVKDYFGTYDVFLGNGDGTFSAKGSAFGPSSQTGTFVLGDFNNDGIPDVAAIDAGIYASNTSITIFLGNGDGTFAATGSSPAIGYNPTAIATADINEDGNADLIVVEQGSSTSSGGEVVIFLGNGDGTFAQSSSTTSLPAAGNTIVPTDLNGDGHVDLVVGGLGTSGVGILLGNGENTFATVPGLPQAGAANPVVADVNNDGIPDLVFVAATTSYLTICLGNGDGTFTEVSASANPIVTSGSLGIGDFDHDGILDIVYAVRGTTGVGLLFGKGDGTFVQAVARVAYGYDFSGDFVVADFNGDGWPDVVTIDGSGRTIVASLTAPTETATASATVALAAPGTHLADAGYAGDSRYMTSVSGTIPLWGVPPATSTNLTVTSGGSAVSSVAPGTVITLTASVMSGSNSVAAGQVNFCDALANHCTDIHLLGTGALSSDGTATLKFVPGPGAHSYKAEYLESGLGLSSSSAAVSLTVGPAPSPVFTDTASMSASGNPGEYTLTATITGYGGSAPPTGSISFLDTSFSNASLGTATLGLSTAGTGWNILQTPTATTNPLAEASGDFNGDGIPDVAVLWAATYYGGPYSISIFLGNGAGAFTTGPTIALSLPGGSVSSSLITGDFNADGKSDLAVLSYSYGSANTNFVTTLLGAGDGTFPTIQSSNALNQAGQGGDVIQGSMVTADFNGDGKLDVAVVGACVAPCGATILLGNGDGTFQDGTIFAASEYFTSIATGDFNGDGIPDLVAVVYEFGTDPSIFLGKGDGTFTAKTTSFSLYSPTPPIVIGDFNGDGVPDLAFSDIYGVEIGLGKGDGTFNKTSASPMAANGTLYSLTAGDFNHDGKPDLATVEDGDQLILFIGAGDGTFAATDTTPAVSQDFFGPFTLLAADFNEDGIPDLAMLTGNEAYVTTLLTLPTQTASATIAGIALVGPGTHDVEASFPGDGNYPAAVSSPYQLYAGLTPLTITPAGGTYSTGQTVRMSESIPGATIYYQASGMVNTNGYIQYTGPLTLNYGGNETITAFARETGYDDSSYTTVEFALNLPIAPAPVISPSGGSFAGPQTATIIDAIGGASIYYTTDGTVPTMNSTIYTGPITVSTSETIAAIAFAGGYSASSVTTAQFFIQSSQSSFIYTIAGTGNWGYGGDGGPAVEASLNEPANTVIGGAGNIYIADSGNNLIRKVDVKTGVITSVAGTGIPGYSGDGGPATSAQLNDPYAVAMDGSGNLYILDVGNRVVRKVDAAGNITTYAGSTSATTLGDGGPATNAGLTFPFGLVFDKAGNLYIADEARVRRVTKSTGIITTVAGNGTYGYSGDGGPATSAELTQAAGLAVDASGNLYFADEWNGLIRKVAADTGIVTTVAGMWSNFGFGGFSGDGGPATSAQLSGPQGIAVDPAGNLYIADTQNYALREVTAADGIIRSIAGHPGACTTLSGDGGRAVESGLCWAPGVSLDSAGDLYIADMGSIRIRKLTSSIAPPSKTAAQPVFNVSEGTYAGAQSVTVSDATPGAQIYLSMNGPVSTTAASTAYHGPIDVTGSATLQAVAVAPGYLPSAPVSASYTVTTPPAAIMSTFAGNGKRGASGMGGAASGAEFAYPEGIAIDGSSNLYIADYYNSVVWMVSAATGKIDVVAGIPGVFNYSGDGGRATGASLNYPLRVAVDSAGNLYIADSLNNRVRKVDAKTGIISTYAGGNTQFTLGDGGPATQAWLDPNGLAFDSAGNLYISDDGNARVRMVSATTGIITTVAGGGTNTADGELATLAALGNLGPLAIDSHGSLYIGDSGRVREVDLKTGIITTICGNGDQGATGDGGPATAAEVQAYGLSLDSADNLYIANGSKVRKVPAGGGPITTIAGSDYAGSGGDDGAATMAGLCGAYDLVFDKTGSLYISDSCNYRIRKVTYPTVTATPSFSLPAGTYVGAQTLKITDTAVNASIYYTTDGTTPTSGSATYSAPITISSSETVKAVAIANGLAESAVASAAYTINQTGMPVITWAVPTPISYGAALGAAQLNATASVPGKFAYFPIAGTVLNPGQQKLTVTFTPSDTTHYSVATSSVTLTVNKAMAAVSPVQSSLNPASVASAVTLTANVTSTVGSPSGTIVFMDGITQLGSVTLSNGTAIYLSSSLAAGAHSITAVYSGDDKFASSTSAVLIQFIESYSIAPSGSSSATVSSSGKATYTLLLTPPIAGDPLTFSATGLPTGATATFSPSSVPAGGGATNVTLTVVLGGSASNRAVDPTFKCGAFPMVLSLMLLPFARKTRELSRQWFSLLAIALIAVAMSGMNACGGGGSTGSTTQSQKYTLTVTATSGTLTQSTRLTLIVQQ